jgi:hypothetical protein
MDLSFHPLTLDALDQAQAESLCLFVAEDERPLRGLAGLVDWRLAGGLSRYLRTGLVTGHLGEALLTLPGQRIGFQKLFIFGTGKSGQTDDELSARLGEGLRKLGSAGVGSAALDLPQGISVEAGVRTLLAEREGPAKAMVFGPDAAALMGALSNAATRGEAPAMPPRVVKVPTPGRATPVSSPMVKPVTDPRGKKKR